MPNSLQSLFHAIAQARDERELRLVYMDEVAKHFGVQHWGIYLLDEQFRLASFDSTPAFNAEDLADLSALCLHMSACLATLRTQPTKFHKLRVSSRTQMIACLQHGVVYMAIDEVECKFFPKVK